jgi:4-amino-4-deoxychorismate lyase
LSDPLTVLVNGTPGTHVSVFDRGLHFGDGVFETIACRRGAARFLDLHMERLTAGCERLRLRFDAMTELRAEVGQLAADKEVAIIKAIVTRGEAVARGYAAQGSERATRIVMCYPWPKDEAKWWNEGIRVRIASQRLGENPALAGLKHLNRLEQVLARAEADAHTQELLLFSSSEQLISGTMTNVFLVTNNHLRTPAIDRCGVAGVMRRVILREAAGAGIETEECALTASDLDLADEVFLTNARIGLWPVRAVNDKAYSPGPVTRRIQQLIHPLLEGAA